MIDRRRQWPKRGFIERGGLLVLWVVAVWVALFVYAWVTRL